MLSCCVYDEVICVYDEVILILLIWWRMIWISKSLDKKASGLNFLNNVFDAQNCVFCITREQLKKSHSICFNRKKLEHLQ